ncbi:monovalent cation/H+ antiporter subunit D [Pseudoduganella albidiflava]|uniref:Monovalent cation/H+ antiporter subunit D n=1 Tax=Pseudoduganella albidiflava TaxID=321983 RepID=A0A411X0U8_9BURK|nr:monovalent cation/H+ antiporter subunit D [Pseudoduganella albidiflava]QBI02589.1 monovalent cation/H+ antiporter subunit D [Pseudoduganella albidiflava]GGY41545.1 monovalent cation/H+ antiporter subunit D [Pseudoduganella albidiflava]
MSLAWTQHLVVVPIVLPLLCGAALAPLTQGWHRLKFAAAYASALALLANALALAALADGGWPGGIGVYLAANWAAPFGIALVADRLSAGMLVLTAVLALAALHYAQPRWSRIGVHFHTLFQFLLMGINGAFLTHDLFNLFVFFEVMLAASYGLVLHGYNVERLRASLQYIAVNLVAALFFLVGTALLYATTGTLNMADMAQRIAALAAGGQSSTLVLLQTGVAVLALAFLVKAAMWPLGFWLPTTYAAASPPVAVMLVLMTKVGAYVILRLWLLLFGDGAGAAARYGYEALAWGGMATIVFGAAGMLATDTAGRLAGYAAIVSSGTLLAVIGYGQPSLVTAALYYFIASTIAIAAFVLLIELVDRIRTPGAAMLALTAEAFAVEDTPAEPKGRGVPAAMAFLSLAFAACALTIAGLPPLSGFVAKFGMFHALVNPGPDAPAIGPAGWTLMALVFVSGLAAIVSLMRFGVRTFWATEAVAPPALHAAEVVPVAALLLVSVLLTVQARPVFDYLARASEDIHRPALYIDRVLGTRPVPAPLPANVPGSASAGEAP